jgi:hypothetical protein
MTNLARPDFKLDSQPGNSYITPAEWWLWLHLRALEPKTKLGGIYADKSGYHNTGKRNADRWPGNYSIRDAVDRKGAGWTHASALDWTFPTAQAGDFALIDRYTSRLLKSAQDPKDPRLDMIIREFYGQADSDRAVEGYDERKEASVSSDPSHLWHIHISFIRSECDDFWGMWALLTVLMGWSVTAWRASLPNAPKPPVVKPAPTPAGLPKHTLGSRELSLKSPQMKGTDVLVLQKWVGVGADGIFGPATKAGVIRYQKIRGLKADGIAGPKTLGPIVKALAD